VGYVSDTAYIAALFTVALAGWIHGALGLGFPMVATPLLALATDVRTAILLSLLPTIASNIGSILSDRHWREVLRQFWPMPFATIVGSILGTQVILRTDPEPYRLLLAAIIMLYLVLDRLRGTGLEPRWRPTKPLMVGAGLTAGLLAGLVNVMAPVLIVFSLETGMAASLMVSVFNVNFLLSKVGQLLAFAADGAIVVELLIAAVPLVLVAMGALALGIRVRRRTDVTRYRRWLKWALWVISGLLIVQHFAG
jgi:uncharacterized membrane protein YfcA